MRRLPPLLLVAATLALPLGSAAQPRRHFNCPPGQTPVFLQQGPGTPMVPYVVRTSQRCMTPRQLSALRGGAWGCHRNGRAVVCRAIVPQSPPRPTPSGGGDRPVY